MVQLVKDNHVNYSHHYCACCFCRSFVLVSLDLLLSGWPIIPNSACWPNMLIDILRNIPFFLYVSEIWMFWVHLFAKEALIVDMDGKMTEEELFCYCSFLLITWAQSKKLIKPSPSDMLKNCRSKFYPRIARISHIHTIVSLKDVKSRHS